VGAAESAEPADAAAPDPDATPTGTGPTDADPHGDAGDAGTDDDGATTASAAERDVPSGLVDASAVDGATADAAPGGERAAASHAPPEAPDAPGPHDAPDEEPARPAAPHGRHGAPVLPEPGGLRALGRALRPHATRSQVVVGVLCALLGFALVAQVSQTQEDQLSSLRQSDLVRLLDDVTQRSGELEDQVASLEATRDELRSGSGRERAALEVAREQEQTQGILSGRLPAQGPGVEIEVAEDGSALDAFLLFNVLEELRNAGAEAMEVNGVRLVASSYFEDTADGVVVDGQRIASPYRWTVIGDPSTLETALEIPGGAMATLRSDGARTTIQQQAQVEVTATREPSEPRFATPVPADE
jgi:uncharacterized protein YlxW (UPF0749 family)